MHPEDIATLRADLPEALDFTYYADRESAWLLKSLMPDCALVRALRAMACGKLLDRPLVKPLISASGGTVGRADIAALAEAGRLGDFAALPAPVLRALEGIYDQPWLDFELSFDAWTHPDWHWAQLSRPGGNLVVQLGFPGEHAALLARYLPPGDRTKFEYHGHPVRRTGRPTLAWARLDIDLKSRTALIEEVQSDWLRFVRREVRLLQARGPRSHQLAATQAYEAALTRRYDKLWSRALLLAVLMLLRDRLGVRDIFLHQPEPGVLLKHISGAHPPRSLYTALPKAFCFAPTRETPDFLLRKRRKDLRKLPRDAPLFWRLTF